MRFAFVALFALIAAGASASTGSDALYTAIDVVRPPASGESPWDGDRMRGARERLKDILPGSRL